MSPAPEAGARSREGWPGPRAAWLAWACGALGAGWLLAVVLTALVPSSIVIRVGEPGGLVPPMLIGVHDVERNYGHPIRWTTGRARLRWPGRFGADPTAVVITLAGFPGRQPDQVEVQVNGRATRHAVSDRYADIRVPLPRATRAPLDIAITSLTTRPPADGRTLGVRLEAVTIEQRPLAERLGSMISPAAVIVFGAIAFLAGAWAAGANAGRWRRLRWAGLAWTMTAVAAAAVAPTALRADTWLMLGPIVLGALVLLLLARAGHAPVVACASALAITLQGLVIVTWCASAFVDVPRWDIWEVVPLLEKQEAQGLTLGDLWAPHHEHRPVVARVALLANVALSRWNHWNELWLILALTGIHVLLVAAYLRHAGQSHRLAIFLSVAGAGTFIATATQWENFLQGWQVTLVAGAAASSAAFLLLSVGVPGWGRVAGAGALVLTGTAGFASCLLAWPLGAAAIAVRRGPGWRSKALGWGAFGGLVIAAYVRGLVRPEGLPPPAAFLTSPEAFARVVYGLCLAIAMPVWYEPTPFADTHPMARWVLPAIGATAMVVATGLLVAHLRDSESRRRQAWLFPTLLVAFAAGACGVAAVGRVPLGLHAMTASRYIAFTALFWVGLLLLLTVAAPFRSRAGRAAGLTLASLIVVAGLRAWGDSLPYFELHHVTGVLGREALLRADWPNTMPIYPVPPVLDERRQFLMRHRLSLYRPGAR